MTYTPMQREHQGAARESRAPRRLMASWWLLIWSVTLGVASTACESVVFSGRTGISVDSHGQPVADVALCDGFIDRLTVYVDQGAGTRTVAELRSTDPIKGAGEVALIAPAAPWSVQRPLAQLQPGVEYIAYGGSHSGQWASAHVSFTTHTLSRLQPGQVLYQRYDADTDTDRDVIVSQAQFRSDPCRE